MIQRVAPYKHKKWSTSVSYRSHIDYVPHFDRIFFLPPDLHVLPSILVHFFVENLPHFQSLDKKLIGPHVDEISMFSHTIAPSFSYLYLCNTVIEHFLLFSQTAHGYFGLYPCHLCLQMHALVHIHVYQ